MKEELFGYAVGRHDVDELAIQECALVLGELDCSACIRQTSNGLAHPDNIEILQVALKLDQRWPKLDFPLTYQLRPVGQYPLRPTTEDQQIDPE